MMHNLTKERARKQIMTTNNNSTDRSELSSANEPADHQEDDRTTNNNNHNKNEETKKNIFRDTSLRYLGYANEVGESFRYQYPRGVGPSYWIAAGYCCADAGWSGYNSYCQNSSNRNINNISNKGMIIVREEEATQASSSLSSSSSPSSSAVVVAGTVVMDTLVWQLLASVLIPGATIHGIVRY
jgi:Mitochondrial 18 KDa protein (MTP18)